MSAILDKIKAARRKIVEIKDKDSESTWHFTIIRPTPMEAMDWLTNEDGTPITNDQIKIFYDEKFNLQERAWRSLAKKALQRFVVDWDVHEIDIYPGGSAIAAPFDNDAFVAWADDKPAIYAELSYNIFEAWIEKLYKQDDIEKKSTTGLESDN